MTPAAQHTHCDHECVCPDYEFQSDDTGGCLDPCAVIFHGKKRCPHDTRASHSAQPQRKDAVHNIIELGKSALAECEKDGWSSQTIQAKRDVLEWVKQEYDALLQAEVGRE